MNIKKSKGRPKKLSKEQVLENSMHVFWRCGYDASSVSKLCEANALKAPSLYSNFKDKSDLFIQVLDYYHQDYCTFLKGLAQDVGSTKDALDSILLRSLKNNSSEQKLGCLIANSTTHAFDENPEIARKLHQLQTRNESLIEACIQKGVDSGEVQSQLSAKQLAHYVNGVVQGAALMARATQSSASVTDLITATRLSLIALLNQPTN